MAVRPISADRLVAQLARTLARHEPGYRLRVAVDGPPPADPGGWAERIAVELPALGRPALHVPASGFLRPASQRYEEGRTNPDAFFERWLDDSGLRREVLDPAGPTGDGRVLPSLWDRVTDRATRAGYVALPPGAVVLVSGALLLGAGLPFDLEIHFDVSAAALARRMPAELGWTLPAYRRYTDEVGPAEFADVVVRLDDLDHPALVEPD